MNLSTAIEGYLLDIQTSYSKATVLLYRKLLAKVVRFLGDPDVSKVTLQDLQRFIHYLQTDYCPIRPDHNPKKLSPSAIDNYWKCIRSFFGWASENLNIERPDIRLARPAYKLPEVIPFTEAEVQRLLNGCEYTDEATAKSGTNYKMRRPTANRDKALILLLLDTGLRVGEVCRLTIQDVNMETGEILVACLQQNWL